MRTVPSTYKNQNVVISRIFAMLPSTKTLETLGTQTLSVALIGPEERRRHALANALAGTQASVTRELPSYPELDDVPRLLEAEYDVIFIELDSNPEHALELVENICGSSSITVMVYSAKVDSELLVRCMRAGAREFLTDPIALSTIEEAMVRTSVRRPTARPARKTLGKLLLFISAKGGSGVTTIASNFAVSLARESGGNAVFIDLNLPLGDAALDLGISVQYSTAEALQQIDRLDFTFLSKLLTKHSSGLYVLAAPDRYSGVTISDEAVHKLLLTARQNFDYVVVDGGSRFGAVADTLIGDSSTVYLVTQVGISELRNANRLISNSLKSSQNKLEIVLNRYTSRTLGIDEASIAKALTVPVRWKIPNDYPAVRSAQSLARPVVLEDSPISRAIRTMSRTASGLSATAPKKKRFALFG
jgi:pilus assembly protein CpaE